MSTAGQRYRDNALQQEFEHSNPHRFPFLTWLALRGHKFEMEQCYAARKKCTLSTGDYVRASKDLNSNGNNQIDEGMYVSPHALAAVGDLLYVHKRDDQGYLYLSHKWSTPEYRWWRCSPLYVIELRQCHEDGCDWIGREFDAVHRDDSLLCPRCLKEM